MKKHTMIAAAALTLALLTLVGCATQTASTNGTKKKDTSGLTSYFH